MAVARPTPLPAPVMTAHCFVELFDSFFIGHLRFLGARHSCRFDVIPVKTSYTTWLFTLKRDKSRAPISAVRPFNFHPFLFFHGFQHCFHHGLHLQSFAKAGNAIALF